MRLASLLLDLEGLDTGETMKLRLVDLHKQGGWGGGAEGGGLQKIIDNGLISPFSQPMHLKGEEDATFQGWNSAPLEHS